MLARDTMQAPVVNNGKLALYDQRPEVGMLAVPQCHETLLALANGGSVDPVR